MAQAQMSVHLWLLYMCWLWRQRGAAREYSRERLPTYFDFLAVFCSRVLQPLPPAGNDRNRRRVTTV